MHATLPLLRQHGFPAVRRGRIEPLQVNLGCRCNQSGLHCHSGVHGEGYAYGCNINHMLGLPLK